jgi:hypothetical protein
MSLSKTQVIPENDSSDLSNLISLCLSALWLKIDDLLDTRHREYVMIALDSLSESEAAKQVAEIGKGDICVSPLE